MQDFDQMSASLGEADQEELDYLDEERIDCLVKFGYPEEYVRYCLINNEASYCLASYYLIGED